MKEVSLKDVFLKPGVFALEDPNGNRFYLDWDSQDQLYILNDSNDKVVETYDPHILEMIFGKLSIEGYKAFLFDDQYGYESNELDRSHWVKRVPYIGLTITKEVESVVHVDEGEYFTIHFPEGTRLELRAFTDFSYRAIALNQDFEPDVDEMEFRGYSSQQALLEDIRSMGCYQVQEFENWNELYEWMREAGCTLEIVDELKQN